MASPLLLPSYMQQSYVLGSAASFTCSKKLGGSRTGNCCSEIPEELRKHPPETLLEQILGRPSSVRLEVVNPWKTRETSLPDLLQEWAALSLQNWAALSMAGALSFFWKGLFMDQPELIMRILAVPRATSRDVI